MKKDTNEKPGGLSLRNQAEEKIARSKRENGLSLEETDQKRLLHELQVHQIELEMQNEELRRAQLETEELRARYADLYDFAPVGYLTLNERGLVSQINFAAAQLLGSARASLVNKPFSSFIPKESPFWALYREDALQSLSKGSCDLVLKRQDGTSIDVHMEYAPFIGNQTRVIRIGLTDMTERKRAEERLRESEALFRGIFDNTTVGIVLAEPDGGIVLVNDAFCRMLGYNREELLTFHVLDITHPEDREANAENIRQALAGRISGYELDKRYVRKDGSLFWANLTVTEVLDAAGRPLHAVAVVTDISDRKAAEETQHRYDLLANQSREIILFLKRDDGSILDANSAAVEAYGYNLEELLGLTIYDLRIPDTLPLVAEQMTKAEIQGVFFETVHRRKDGTTFPVEISSRGVTVNGREILISIVRDITERKQLEDAQLFLIECGWQDEDFFQGLARYLAQTIGADYVCIDCLEEDCLTARTVAVYFDGKFEDNLVYTLKDTPCGKVVGQTICSFPEGVRHLFPRDAVLQEMLAESYIGTTLWGAGGQPIGLIAMISRKPLANPRLAESILKLTAVRAAGELERKKASEELRSARDELELRVQERTAELQAAFEQLESEVAERKRIGEQLLQAHKMEALGTMAGGIAHDFNNILAAMLGFTELAIEDIPPGGPGRKSLEHILKSVHRGRELVKQILAFSRKAENIRGPMSIIPVIDETLSLLRVSIPANVRIVPHIAVTSDTIVASPVEVQQILMNLGKNGALAMEKNGGTLEIGLGNVSFSPDSPSLPLGLTAGEYVELAVRDGGTGMSPDLMAKIFDPFFTTREKGTGTGMGLPVVYGIVKSLGGAITVESEQGTGSAFRVFLPKAIAPAAAKTVKPEGQTQGAERILFVEDESQLAEWAQTALERLGYEVTTAPDGGTALEIFSADPLQFDLVITDQAMPIIDGLALTRKLLEIRSDLPVILYTGHDDLVSAEPAKALGIREFLEKPLGGQELAQAIRRALDGKGEA
jgi:two-component system, cell cycle sensor histidine kinase and response regulator CckA